MKFWSLSARVLAFILTFLIVASPAQAQSSTRVHGQVADPTGAVIPGATVSFKSASGLVLTAKSDGLGNYMVKDLPPGKYTVTIKVKGFAPLTQEMTVVAGQDNKFDVKLEIAMQEQEVDVQSDAARVNVNPDINSSSGLSSGKGFEALSDD